MAGKSENILKVRFLAFKAVDHPGLCDQFSKGHLRVLEDFDITNVTTNNDSWKFDPDVYVIVAQLAENDEIVGGIRIERYNRLTEMPVVSAVSYIDPKISDYVNRDFEAGTAEVCGLWNSKRVFGRGISSLLSKAAVALSSQIGVKTLYCIVAQYTFDLAVSIGFEPLKDLGEGGFFKYPNDRFQASVLRVPDIENLKGASAKEKLSIEYLRNNPVGVVLEEVNGRKLIIDYQLDLKKTHPPSGVKRLNNVR